MEISTQDIDFTDPIRNVGLDLMTVFDESPSNRTEHLSSENLSAASKVDDEDDDDDDEEDDEDVEDDEDDDEEEGEEDLDDEEDEEEDEDEDEDYDEDDDEDDVDELQVRQRR